VSPGLLSVAQERATVKTALITVKDLGQPWVLDDDDDAAKEEDANKPDEFCPGQLTSTALAPPRALARRDFKAGTKPGVALGVFSVSTLYPGQEKAWRDAIATVVEGCATHRDEDNLYVTTTPVDAPLTVPGADEVIGYIERIHQDIDRKKLLYVRQYLHTRTGRVTSTVQYAVIQPKSDPTGSDLTQAVGLVSKQVKKTVAAFRP